VFPIEDDAAFTGLEQLLPTHTVEARLIGLAVASEIMSEGLYHNPAGILNVPLTHASQSSFGL
jgi:hypothetical protein